MADLNDNVEEAPPLLAAGMGLAVNDMALQAIDQPPIVPPAAPALFPQRFFKCRMSDCSFTSNTAKGFPPTGNATKVRAFWQQQATQFAKHANSAQRTGSALHGHPQHERQC
jgi:hypothetical protein